MVNGFNAYVKLYTYWDNSQLKEFLQITKLPKSYIRPVIFFLEEPRYVAFEDWQIRI